MNYNQFAKYYPVFYEESKKSEMQHQLCAGVVQNKKLITKPCCNNVRNYCRGNFFGSIHAEMHALMNYFGKHLTFDKVKQRWCLLHTKFKKYKKS